MSKTFEIKPLKGLGEILFGMSPAEVIEIMNEEQVYENWMGGNLNDALLFHGIIFHFDVCDGFGSLENAQLDDIDIYSREDISIFGKL